MSSSLIDDSGERVVKDVLEMRRAATMGVGES